MSTTQGGDRRQAMSYFRYASLVAGEIAAGEMAAETPAVIVGADAENAVDGPDTAGDAAGLTTALWRAAHALSPAAAANERSAGTPGPYTAAAAREAASPAGGAGQLDRRG